MFPRHPARCSKIPVFLMGKDGYHLLSSWEHNNFKSGYLTCNCFKKVCQFAPLNRYYIIIDEVFFDNCLVIIYLLIVCKKTNNSFILVYFNYLFITSCIQKKIIHSFWSVEYCWIQKEEYFSQKRRMPLHVMEQPPRFFALAYRASDACIYQ